MFLGQSVLRSPDGKLNVRACLEKPENSPAQSALCFVIDLLNILPGRRGRHRMNLIHVLEGDLRNRDLQFSKYEDI